MARRDPTTTSGIRFPIRPFLRQMVAIVLASCVLTGGLAGCASGGASRTVIGDTGTSDPASLVDGYLIARGMALSYGRSGRAGPPEIAILIRYDRAALIAVATAQLEPGDARSKQAERALQALVDYTGDNDLRPDPVVPPAAAIP